MKKFLAYFFALTLCSIIPVIQGLCLNSDDIVRMKAAGIDDETIRIIINEKTVETCAFSVSDILEMKKGGLGNATIRTIIQNASFMKNKGIIDYTKDIRRIRSLTVEDIIALKDAGISDAVIKAVISGMRSEADVDEERAWNMLEKMGIIVDER